MNLDPAVIQIERIIDLHGWAVQQSMHAGQQVIYTIGLDRLKHAEVMIVGEFDAEAAAGVLNAIAERVATGASYGDWSQVDDVVRDHPIWLREVTAIKASDIADVAAKRNQGDVRLLHAYLPDLEGKFPWDDACDDLLRAQAALGDIYAKHRIH